MLGQAGRRAALFELFGGKQVAAARAVDARSGGDVRREAPLGRCLGGGALLRRLGPHRPGTYGVVAAAAAAAAANCRDCPFRLSLAFTFVLVGFTTHLCGGDSMQSFDCSLVTHHSSHFCLLRFSPLFSFIRSARWCRSCSTRLAGRCVG